MSSARVAAILYRPQCVNKQLNKRWSWFETPWRPCDITVLSSSAGTTFNFPERHISALSMMILNPAQTHVSTNLVCPQLIFNCLIKVAQHRYLLLQQVPNNPRLSYNAAMSMGLTHWGWEKWPPFFADDIFKCISFKENVWPSIKISLKFVPKGSVNNIPALVQIMAWRSFGAKPLSGPMLAKPTDANMRYSTPVS